MPSGGQGGYVRDPEGNFATFDFPASPTTPRSINAHGAVTGSYNFGGHGFVRRADRTLISFDPPGSVNTQPVSINAKGAITGTYQETNLRVHGFVRRPGGEIVSFDPPESTGTIVLGINNAGAITGHYTAASGRTFGFVRDPEGKFTSFDPFLDTLPTTNINNEGAIAGTKTVLSGFVRSPNGTITLFTPPFCQGLPFQPTSINDEGVITGSCTAATPPFPHTVGWVRYP